MTLTGRLLAFFLATLAVVLGGFSTGVYLLTSRQIHARAADRLTAALRTLAAAADISAEGVEWEPAGRALALDSGGNLVWQVWDGREHVVDGSPGSAAALGQLGIHPGRAIIPDAVHRDRADQQGRPWRIVSDKVQPLHLRAAGPAEGKHAVLIVTVAIGLDPVRAELSRLALTLAGLSGGVLVVALVGGYAVCRRALVPVTRMATAARNMGGADFTERLPVAPVNDELADLGHSFNSVLDRLHESFERQRRFTGEAAHQLRTPLAAVLGQAEVALRRDRPADEYRDALESVRGQAAHLRRIVDALLFLARADAEAAPPATERLDLAAWLPEHLWSWADHPRAADVRFEPAAGPHTVHAPPALLGELVNNLLDNALKYSPPGTPVGVRLARAGDTVSLSVEDGGVGIDPADLPDLFRPFFRSADARRRGVPGVGLGLAVAARLAKAFGGDLTVTSQLGQGSRFTLNLPAV